MTVVRIKMLIKIHEDKKFKENENYCNNTVQDNLLRQTCKSLY